MRKKKKLWEIFVVVGILVLVLGCWYVFKNMKSGPGGKLLYQDL